MPHVNPNTSDDKSQDTYTVRRGDTLIHIANKFEVEGGYRAIASHNGIRNPNRLRVGQVLNLPGRSGGGGGGGGQHQSGGQQGGGQQPSEPQTYRVRRGDNLNKIAQRFNYPGGSAALARANNIANPDLIRVGQELQVGGQAQGGGGDGGGGGGQEQQQQPEQDTGQQQPAQDSGGGGQQQQQPEEDASQQQPAQEPEGGQQEGGGAKDAPVPGEKSWIAAAINYNNRAPYSKTTWKAIQGVFGTTPDGAPGKMTARAAYRWQEANKLTKDGQVGPSTAKKLEAVAGIKIEAGGGEEIEYDGPVGGLRNKILEIAHSTLSSRTGHNYYSQPGKLTLDPLAKKPLRSDCSQWVRAVYIKAGAGDPGTYTGAMVGKAKKTQSPKPGDLMLKNGHVELYIGNGETIGHGSPPINKGTTKYWKGKGMYYATYDFLNR